MPLEPGNLLGPYEIIDLLGRGGMGEAWRARDTRLERIVAIKTLNDSVSEAPEFRERFAREARAVSALNHANICALYDVGQQDSISYLVMEFAAGETLSELLRRGPLPTAQALQYAAEVAAALDHAHRQRIVHRDLKPANIIITKSGAKLLDFGIAKLVRPNGEQVLTSGDSRHTFTAEGMVVGTLHYMAPEQLTGKEVDGRSDIFAFGAVLYEMLTGLRAFDADSQATTISKILSGEPNQIGELAGRVPPSLERVVRRCLEKDPDNRWQTARDLYSELKWLAERTAEGRSVEPAATVQAAPRKRRNALLWLTVPAALFVLSAMIASIAMKPAPSKTDRLVRFEVAAPQGASLLYEGYGGGSEISPDGSTIAFVATANGKAVLHTRALDSLSVTVLEGTAGASFPFWSPDGQWIAYFAEGRLRKVPASGGPPQTICEAIDGRGGSWNREGLILFNPSPHDPLFKVAASGGSASPATRLDRAAKEESHSWPHFLPDGQSFLYLARNGRRSQNEIRAGWIDPSRGHVKVIPSNHGAAYAPPGQLLYLLDGSLVAQDFDLAKLQLSQASRQIGWNVSSAAALGYADFSVSRSGVLVYGQGGARKHALAWFSRSGAPLGQAADSDHYLTARLSPDARTIVASLTEEGTGVADLWVIDVARRSRSRLTFEDGLDVGPVWSPSGDNVVFASTPTGTANLFRWQIGKSKPDRLTTADKPQRPNDVSRDGRWIAYEELSPETKRDIWLLPASGGEAQPLVRTPFNESQAQFSPDGRWIAYTSDASGRPEIYVRAIGPESQSLPVSVEGGSQPRWRTDGSELFFLSPAGQLTSVPMRFTGGSPQPGTPVALFQAVTAVSGMSDYQYDVTSDAQRFLVMDPGRDTKVHTLAIAVNWTLGLRP